MAVANTGSLSAAARFLGLSPAVTSAAIKRLENTLGARLFARTTRSLRLTFEGERLLARAGPALESLRAAEDEVTARQAVVEGLVQISMPSDLGRHLALEWLNRFQAKHPRVHLRVQLSDRLANVYREPVDVALRFGKLNDSSMVALPLLLQNRRILCAAPSYIAAHGIPASPAELKDHNCLCFMLDDAVYQRWVFRKDGAEIEVKVDGDRVADDSDAVRRWTIGGHGIAYRSCVDVLNDVRRGRLVQVCSDWEGENVPLYMVCADRRQISPVVRLLHEHFAAECAALPLHAFSSQTGNAAGECGPRPVHRCRMLRSHAASGV